MVELFELRNAGIRAWLSMALPSVDVARSETVPVSTLNELYPNIALFGPNGDNVVAAIDATLNILASRVPSSSTSEVKQSIAVVNGEAEPVEVDFSEMSLFEWFKEALYAKMWERISVHDLCEGWSVSLTNHVAELMCPHWLSGIVLDGFSSERYERLQFPVLHARITGFLGLDTSMFRSAALSRS